MTPKEKARDLVNKFYPNVQWKLGQEDCLDRTKRCALIAVDEILDDDMYDMSEDLFEKRILYWENVKQEIKKL